MPLLQTLSPNARGIIATCLAMVGFIGTDSCIKLASDELPVSQMLALRGIAILAILVALAVATGAYKRLPTFKDRAVGMRAGAECVATVLYYNAIIAIPIASANAVLQMIPLAIVAVAALVFGEKVGWRRWLIILVGFGGVLLVIQPGGDSFQPASLWAVGAMIFYVLRDMTTRTIDRSLPAISINLVTSASVMMLGFAMAPFEDWVTPSPQSLALLGAAACFLTLGYLAVTVAMRTGDVSVSSPFRYSIVLWALLIDLFVFGNQPNTLMLVGIAILVGSGIAMVLRERQVRRTQGS
ncbi:MAG: DMT family transporter [Devosiaceae bacterium]|nr:DMT family transporter [Devosiaceae bacterium MH13]